ncbi:MAG: hypothetical protein K0B37_16065 [Bacteroidales bacterium]|nr:hypothetical protein [Bacteroidales bacterium]
MQFHTIYPSPSLAPFIQHYWILETNVYDGIVTERVVPTGNIEMMFHYRKPFSSISPSGESQTQHRSMISGINHSWFDVSAGGESGSLAVTFYPGAAASFFHLPMTELEDRSIHLGDIVKKEAFSVEEQLAEAASLQERIRIVENFLMKRLRPVATFDTKLIQQGVVLIKKCKGQIRASELAQKLYVTPKTRELISSQWLLTVSWANPVTYVLEANRYLLGGTSSSDFFLPGLIILTITTTVSLIFAESSTRRIKV